jgi:hypothetical protein
MKTNYGGHDAIYRARKADGKPGWQDPESLKETLPGLARKMRSEHAP